MSAKKIIGMVVLVLILSASAGFASYYGANRGLQEAAEPPAEEQREDITPAVETTQVNSGSISISFISASGSSRAMAKAMTVGLEGL